MSVGQLVLLACLSFQTCLSPSFPQVKILMSKPGTAMAHLDSPQGAKNAIHHLHGRKLLGQTLELK